MNTNEVKSKIVEVLQDIQSASGLECPSITGATKPIEALPQFDSKVWPAATFIIAENLGIIISNDINIFCADESCDALTLDQIVAGVMGLIKFNQITEPSKRHMVNR